MCIPNVGLQVMENLAWDKKVQMNLLELVIHKTKWFWWVVPLITIIL